MITFINLRNSNPYTLFKKKYDQAIKSGQPDAQAAVISSFNKTNNEVDSRVVNIKFLESENFIFFTNYNSPKSLAFQSHNQIGALFYWASINAQIRLKAKISKTSCKFNQKYFFDRSEKKNALAISSNQSKQINSYSQIEENYNKSLKNDDLKKCPEFWGGYSFTPYYFEFWEGHESRINKREVFDKIDGVWKHSFLQP